MKENNVKTALRLESVICELLHFLRYDGRGRNVTR